MGASPCLIADSKKSIPSSAGVFGVLVLVGDEPADEPGVTCLLLWVFMVGRRNELATLEVADLIFGVAIPGDGDGGEDKEGESDKKMSCWFVRV